MHIALVGSAYYFMRNLPVVRKIISTYQPSGMSSGSDMSDRSHRCQLSHAIRSDMKRNKRKTSTLDE